MLCNDLKACFVNFEEEKDMPKWAIIIVNVLINHNSLVIVIPPLNIQRYKRVAEVFT